MTENVTKHSKKEKQKELEYLLLAIEPYPAELILGGAIGLGSSTLIGDNGCQRDFGILSCLSLGNKALRAQTNNFLKATSHHVVNSRIVEKATLNF